MKKGLLLVLTLMIPGASLSLWMAGHDERGLTKGSPARSRSTLSDQPPPHEDSIPGIGFVEPVSEVRKLVFKVNGVIARCPAEVGRDSKKGEVLMELDNREQLAAIAIAEAEWKLAESERDQVLSGVNPHQVEVAYHKVELLREQVRHSQKEHDRYRGLIARNSVSPSDYDKVRSGWIQKQAELQQAEADLRHLRHHVRKEDRRLADAKLAVAKAKLDLARQQYEDTILRAPFDGTVLELLKREGEASRLFDPEPVAIFGDPSRLRVRAEVDERFVASLRVGQEAVVRGRGLGNKPYPGRVALIKPIMGKKTVFSRSATERKDLDVVQVLIDMDRDFVAPIGLEIDVEMMPVRSPAPKGPPREMPSRSL
jgi:multidrug resistance efflux pump